MNNRTAFRGGKKPLVHSLVRYEKALLKVLLPMVPARISTVHLTMMTLAWSLGVLISGWAAADQPAWLWVFNACIILQYVTDMLDGAVGRLRKTGLVKWGFYMDHFLDYVFLCAVVAGYSFLLPPSYAPWLLACLAAAAGFMVHTVLDFGITGRYKISWKFFGVSELRLSLVVFNILVMIFGTGLLHSVFPFAVAGSYAALVLLVMKSQAIYRRMDLSSKKESA